jgi:hypothetical protein
MLACLRKTRGSPDYARLELVNEYCKVGVLSHNLSIAVLIRCHPGRGVVKRFLGRSRIACEFMSVGFSS